MITTETIRLCMPDATPENVWKYTPHIDAAMIEFSIGSTLRQAAFIATIGHESGSLRTVVENLNYSVEGLMRTWPRRFDSRTAAVYARKPEAIANKVYADRMGNGDEDSGDGWRHRGAGGIQLTGKEDQEKCAVYFGIPVEDIGDWLRTPEGAMRSAGWYWSILKGLSGLADVGNFLRLSQRVNGSGDSQPNGWEDRLKRYNRAAGVLGMRV